MLKKTIKYTDYNGQEREEEFHFNLSKAEILEMELSEPEGLEKTFKMLVDSKDNKKIVDTFKSLILKAYGEKTPDGKHFKKSKELSEAFSQTEAFVELYMSLFKDENAAATFINAVIPQIPDAAHKHPAEL